MCLASALASLATVPSNMVVPANSGTFTVSDLLPRVAVPATPSGCPWDEPNLISFPAGDHTDLTLSANTQYLLSSATTIHGTLTVPASAELIFANTTFELTARSIQVSGRLRIGSPTCRISAAVRHTITLTGARLDSDSSTLGHKGIVVSGATAAIDLFGHLDQPSWSRLAASASAGSSELHLQECVEWAAGATIVVTTTHLVDWRRYHQNEEVVIQSVACETVDYLADGMSTHDFGRVTLTAPLQHPHYAARGEYQAEVGLLSRNVLVRGAAADSLATDPQPSGITCESTLYSEVPCANYYMTGYGGHLIITGSASARLSGAEFYRMGQTNLNGRYPVHFHLLGAAGAASYVSDCSVHESFYRGIVVHGTSSALVTRNVAYDVIGHCYYLESGREENNEVSYNLGALVHVIGHFADFKGQETDTTFTSADLGGAEVPADGAASAFYISNMYNNYTGNAAVGGFSGFAMVNFAEVIGPWPEGDTPDSSFVPKNRPSMPNGFYGNSARSTGYWWNHGACFYIGGVLSVTDQSTGALSYIPGRVVGNPHNRQPRLDNGSAAWFTFVNTKASLCNIPAEDWNVRSKWYNMDINDVGNRCFNTFGQVVFRNVNIRCRTSNGLAIAPPTANRPQEQTWTKKSFKMFRAYDTGQSHVLDSWRIQGCGTQASPMPNTSGFRSAQIWSIPHGVNKPQNQLIMRNITYADGPPDPVKLISFDVGKRDTYGAYMSNLLDADGSLTSRRAGPSDCRPTWIGSANTIRATSSGYQLTPANLWYKLTGLDDGAARGDASSGDARCDLLSTAEYPMWACDRGSIGVAAILVSPNGRVETTASTYEMWGHVAHFGDSLSDGPPLSGDHQVTGPHDHSRRGGWFLQYHSAPDDASTWSSPRQLSLGDVQVQDGGVLLLAFAYPAGTTFAIQRVRSNVGPLAGRTVTYAAASSVAAVRQDSEGTVYYFDGTYLYIRATRHPGTHPLGFGEDGLYVPSSNPGWVAMQITAAWASDTNCGTSDWCRAATQTPPAASVGEIPGTTAPYPCAVSAGPYWPLKSTVSTVTPIDLTPLPPPSPSPPLAPPVAPSPPPSPYQVQTVIVAGGDVADYDNTVVAAITAAVASQVNVPVSDVSVVITSASVRIAITVSASTNAAASSIASSLAAVMATPTAASTFLSTSALPVTVTAIVTPPTVVNSTVESESNTGLIIGAAAAGAAAVLLAILVALSVMLKRRGAAKVNKTPKV